MIPRTSTSIRTYADYLQGIYGVYLVYEDSYVGIVHTAAAAVELVVCSYQLYPPQQTQPGPRHQES